MDNRSPRLIRPEHSATPATSRCAPSWLPVMLLLMAAPFAGSAQAAVDLRVEARPISDPIEVFITVTDANGDPVGGLASSDFAVTLDGTPITIDPTDFSLPPAQDPNEKVSVVFVMDYSGSIQSTALTAMQDAVTGFINVMNPGDYAAIVKFNDTNPDKASVVQPFTQIDGGAGTAALTDATLSAYPGTGTNLLDAVNLAAQQFNVAPGALPAGPKAVIVISDGGENASSATLTTVLENANGSSVALFTIGVGDIAGQGGLELLTSLATETGGGYIPAPSDSEITAAYTTISELLNNEYLLTFPSSITDCNSHTLSVQVTGQSGPASQTFSRCTPAEPASGGGGGGGGSTGLIELAAGLAGIRSAMRRQRIAR